MREKIDHLSQVGAIGSPVTVGCSASFVPYWDGGPSVVNFLALLNTNDGSYLCIDARNPYFVVFVFV